MSETSKSDIPELTDPVLADPDSLAQGIDGSRLWQGYLDPDNITNDEQRRILDYRILMGKRISSLFQGILSDYRLVLEKKGEKLNPWDTQSVLGLDDFIANGTYFRDKARETGVLKSTEDTNEFFERFFPKVGLTEALYELLIRDELLSLAVRNDLLAPEEIEEARRLLCPSADQADQLTKSFFVDAWKQRKSAIQFFKNRWDIEKLKRFYIFLKTGFGLGKRLMTSGVQDAFSPSDVFELSKELDEDFKPMRLLDSYFTELMGEGESPIELPPLLKSRLLKRGTDNPGIFRSGKSPRCDLSHSYFESEIWEQWQK